MKDTHPARIATLLPSVESRECLPSKLGSVLLARGRLSGNGWKSGKDTGTSIAADGAETKGSIQAVGAPELRFDNRRHNSATAGTTGCVLMPHHAFDWQQRYPSRSEA